MTLSLDGTDIGQIIEVATWVGSIVTMLVAGLIVYLMARPPRHVRRRRDSEPRTAEPDAVTTEELWRLVDRMEMRLEVLERALADRTGQRPAIGADQNEQALASVEDRDSGRKE